MTSRTVALSAIAIFAFAFAGCSAGSRLGATPQGVADAARTAAQPTPGRTFLDVTWRASFVHGAKSGDIVFTAKGQEATVYVKETLANAPYGAPYHAKVIGGCASIVSEHPNRTFRIRAAATGSCQIVLSDSLPQPNVKKYAIRVP